MEPFRIPLKFDRPGLREFYQMGRRDRREGVRVTVPKSSDERAAWCEGYTDESAAIRAEIVGKAGGGGSD